MIIPSNKEERTQLYIELVEKCFNTRNDRKSRYDILRNWFLFGSAVVQSPTEYNKLYSHIDLLSSYLFSGETTQFVIEIPDNDDGKNYELELRKAEMLIPSLNDVWHDSNTDITFNEGLVWALVLETVLVKFVPMGNNEYAPFVVMPDSFGVLREDLMGLDQQEAFAHEFFMPKSALERLIKDFPEAERTRILDKVVPQEVKPEESAMPSGVKALIINTTSPTITGELQPQNINYNFGGKIMEDGVICHELWVYDDATGDYRVAKLVDGEILLHDTEKNPFIENEHPFIKITPNPLSFYFWGRSEMMYLIPLQQWINERIPQLKELMAKQAKPPVSFTGFSAPGSEIYEAFMKAGGFFSDSNPATMSKIEQFKPDMGNDIFRELQTIEQMFNEISGIREIMKGGGESGVRAMGHADLLARLGSSRAKKKAYILEDAVEKCAHILLKCMKKYDGTHYRIKIGEGKPDIKFVAAQLAKGAMVKVDAHSSSPVFMEQQLEKAMTLYEAKAIDEETLIDAMKFPNSGMLKVKLRERRKREEMMLQQQLQLEQLQAQRGNQGSPAQT